MIGKVKWFKKRKYTGRGIAPKTWEGWLYMLSILILFLVIQVIPMRNNLSVFITILLVLIIVVDAIDIMRKIEKHKVEKSVSA